MRLLHTGDLTLHTFYQTGPKYAILSHTWQQGEEVTFQELTTKQDRHKAGWAKIETFCGLAREKGYDYCWIDTCCIDKTSSTELQESINSMYRYYRESELCVVHLADVMRPVHEGEDAQWTNSFVRSRWFQRGWTLQELIAPKTIEFWSADWSCMLGTKDTLVDPIMSATNISRRALSEFDPKAHFAVDILYWAANRKCTRQEDQAYSLLGLLDINMPLLYGEGGKAFIRLQEEVILSSDDESILAWTTEHSLWQSCLFAPSIRAFSNPARRLTGVETKVDSPHRKCPFCPESFRSPAILDSHMQVCYYGEIEPPRPFVLSGHVLHVRRALLTRSEPGTQDEQYFILLKVSRDEAADNELLLRIEPVRLGKNMRKSLAKNRLNHVLCHREHLYSRQELAGSVSDTEYELLILKSPPVRRS